MCPAVAAAMFFLYYGEHKPSGSGYIPNACTGLGAVYFPDYLANGDYDLDGARTPTETRQGMQNYINSIGKSKTMTCVSYTQARYKAQISAGNPMVVGLQSHPEYGNHWVLGRGYYVRKDPNISYILVNNGHGGANVHITPGYIDYILY